MNSFAFLPFNQFHAAFPITYVTATRQFVMENFTTTYVENYSKLAALSKNTIASYNYHMSKKEDEIKALLEENQLLKENLEATHEQMDKAVARNQMMEDKLQNMKEETDMLKRRNQLLESNVICSEETIAKLEKTIADFEENLETTQEKMEKAVARKQGMEDELHKMKGKNEMLKRRNQLLESNVKSSEETIAKLEKKIANFEGEINRGIVRSRNDKNQIEVLRQTVEQMKDTLNKMRHKLFPTTILKNTKKSVTWDNSLPPIDEGTEEPLKKKEESNKDETFVIHRRAPLRSIMNTISPTKNRRVRGKGNGQINN